MVIEKKYAYCSEPPVGGAKTPTQKKKKIFKNIQKSIISQKLRIAQKSHSCKKWAPDKFQCTLQIWQLLKKVEFLAAQNVPLGRLWRPNAIWCAMKFTPIIFLAHCASFMGNELNSEERRPLLRKESAYPYDKAQILEFTKSLNVASNSKNYPNNAYINPIFSHYNLFSWFN